MATWYSYGIASSTSSTGNDTAWNVWICDGGINSATANTWGQWTTGTADASDVWHRWPDNNGTAYQGVANLQWGQPRELSAEEIEATRIANEQRQREQEQRQREQKEAEEKAEKLLQENLDREQKAAYVERKVIPITTAKGNRYLIYKGRAGNVVKLDERDRAIEKFCIHPIEQCPDEDVMLSQLLWLRWMEEEFLRVANMTRLAA